jgi:hypothetical protein
MVVKIFISTTGLYMNRTTRGKRDIEKKAISPTDIHL